MASCRAKDSLRTDWPREYAIKPYVLLLDHGNHSTDTLGAFGPYREVGTGYGAKRAR